jgi:hypothetical protein
LLGRAEGPQPEVVSGFHGGKPTPRHRVSGRVGRATV